METKDIHKIPADKVFSAMDSSSSGLTGQQAEERQKTYGYNSTAKQKEKSLFVSFLSNFTHLMAILLWVAGIVGFLADLPQLAIAIWMVNIINGLFSFWQEFRAGKATKALDKLLPSYARVIRDGREIRLETKFLVPGDVVLLGEGDIVPADCRLVEDNDLNVDQSAFTGESVPIHKMKDETQRDDLSRVEQPNLVFMSCAITSGTGKAVVVETGMKTEFGKIADLTRNVKEEPSPLQKEMRGITRTVSAMALLVSAVFFFLAILLVDTPVAGAFIFALGMIVAFIPEGLLPTVTLSLAMAVQRMARKHALVKRLSSVETLGCATVICTDKTGTLTQNEMTVTDLWIPGRNYTVTGSGYDHRGGRVLYDGRAVTDDEIVRLLATAGLCTNAHLLEPDEENPCWTVLGDPTEAALLVAARKAGVDMDVENYETPRLRELPFDSRRKRMSSIHRLEDSSRRLVCMKGAPREVMDLCRRIRIEGKETVLDEAMRTRIIETNDTYARAGLRVLAVAERLIRSEADRRGDGMQAETPVIETGQKKTTGQKGPAGSSSELTVESVERDLTFLGLVAMADPPRKEVAQAVARCRQAGIRIIMITGDYGLTAQTIARRIGIVTSRYPKVVTGRDLEEMDETGLKGILAGEVIFARVAPEQKLRIVSALQSAGEVVAVTGDGVNDAPALKKADIGVAMGASGTDVAKEAADMILTDDNFASIVGAVEEGRTVYDNIRRFITYIFSSNMAEALPAVLHLFSGGTIPLPLTVMQVLAVDLGTDMVPAMGLGVEEAGPAIMDRPPRSLKEPLLNRKILVRALLWYGMLEAVLSLGSYFFFNYLHGWPGSPLAASGTLYAMSTTMTFAAIVMGQVGVVHACRSRIPGLQRKGFFSNRLLLIGIGAELLVLFALMYVPPLKSIFGTAPLGWREWLFLIPIPLIIIALDGIRKTAEKKRAVRKASTDTAGTGETA